MKPAFDNLADPEGAKIGVFFLVFERNMKRRLDRLLPFAEVDTIGGFKTLSEGHVDVWKLFQKSHPSLRRVPYEYFPRGRVNWIEDSNTFLLLADRYFFDNDLHEAIITEWGLRGHKVQLARDPHYQTPRFRRAFGLD